MKIAILGAAGVRTPLIVQAIARRQERLELQELALMDIDAERMELIRAVSAAATANEPSGLKFRITHTGDAREALDSADFVITTFRVGGIESRQVDEGIPLKLGVLGQETTGPGGFAMGIRTIPVILDYVAQMRELCPKAWLVNFANPAGMLAEAVFQVAGWERVVGICDSPHSMGRVAAALFQVPFEEVYLDYFGLNHLGWIRSVIHDQRDYLPQFLEIVQRTGEIPGLPFDAEMLSSLGMVPNEYLYYYYYSRQAVQNILRAEQTRSELISGLNQQLFASLSRLKSNGDHDDMLPAYYAYLQRRGETYMANETGHAHGSRQQDPAVAEAVEEAFSGGEGYAGVALDLIEALSGDRPRQMILNLPNCGAVHGMGDGDVVEIPAFVGRDLVRPLAVGKIPAACLGLMQQVKAYEQLTIQASVERSYAKAVEALTIHPLVCDYTLAREILDGYIQSHGPVFPRLG